MRIAGNHPAGGVQDGRTRDVNRDFSDMRMRDLSRVVPANAGTHTPCRLGFGGAPVGRRSSHASGGYGSRRSPGRAGLTSDARVSRGHRLAARHRRIVGGGVSFRGAGGVRRLCRRRYLLRHLRIPDHRDHPVGSTRRLVFVSAVLRAPGAPPAAGAVRHGGADRDSVAALFAHLGTAGIFPLRRGGGHLHLELLLLAADRLFRPRGGGKAAAAHLVARGRGAVLSRAAAAVVGAVASTGAADGCGCRSR